MPQVASILTPSGQIQQIQIATSLPQQQQQQQQAQTPTSVGQQVVTGDGNAQLTFTGKSNQITQVEQIWPCNFYFVAQFIKVRTKTILT